MVLWCCGVVVLMVGEVVLLKVWCSVVCCDVICVLLTVCSCCLLPHSSSHVCYSISQCCLMVVEVDDVMWLVAVTAISETNSQYI